MPCLLLRMAPLLSVTTSFIAHCVIGPSGVSLVFDSPIMSKNLSSVLSENS